MFLNREQAALEDEQVKVVERAQMEAQWALLKLRNDMLESLLKAYANRIVDLEVRLALLEAAQKRSEK